MAGHFGGPRSFMQTFRFVVLRPAVVPAVEHWTQRFSLYLFTRTRSPHVVDRGVGILRERIPAEVHPSFSLVRYRCLCVFDPSHVAEVPSSSLSVDFERLPKVFVYSLSAVAFRPRPFRARVVLRVVSLRRSGNRLPTSHPLLFLLECGESIELISCT